MVTGLLARQPSLDISESDIQCVTLAGLLHDVGHGPFSHMLEHWLMARNIEWHHEDMSGRLVRFMAEKYDLGYEEAELDLIEQLIAGRVPEERRHQSYLFDVVSNPHCNLDVDKFDYLLRDAKYSNVQQTYNAQRLVDSCAVVGGHIAYPRKEMQNIYELFHTRYVLFKCVYTHRVATSIQLMLSDVLSSANDHMIRPVTTCLDDPELFCTLTDDLFQEMRYTCNEALLPARQLLERIERRRLYVMVWEAHLSRPGYENLCGFLTAECICSFCEGVPAEDVALSTERLHYGAGEHNPLNKVTFFKSFHDTSLYDEDSERGLLMTRRFEEFVVRVFCRDSTRESALTRGMLAWQKAHGLAKSVLV